MTKSFYLMKLLQIYFQIHTSWNYYIWWQRPALDKQQSETFNQWKTYYVQKWSQKKKSNQSFETFQSFQSQLRSLIASLKNKYYSKVIKRLLDPSASPKMYWSILKTFLNKKKIPLFRQFFMIINILQILNKKLKSLILTFLNNVHV